MKSIINKVYRKATQLIDKGIVKIHSSRNYNIKDFIKPSFVVVNFKSKKFIDLLLYTIRETENLEYIYKILIVDNSGEILRKDYSEFKNVKIINAKSVIPGHGNGLRHGIDYLNKKGWLTNYTGVMDADIIFNKNKFIESICKYMDKEKIEILGQAQYDVGYQYIHPSFLLFRTVIYGHKTYPFVHSGAPAELFMKSAINNNLNIEDYPVRKNNLIVHRGRGSVNKARFHSDVEGSAHYHGNENGAKIWKYWESKLENT